MSKRKQALEAMRETLMQPGSRFTSELIKLIDEAIAEPDLLDDINEFHKKFGPYYTGKPQVLPDTLRDFRLNFMREETSEYAMSSEHASMTLNSQPLLPDDRDAIAVHLEDMLDALVDLTYVALGTAHLHGFNFREAWRRVHAANMKKVRATRADQSVRNSLFDVIKPEGWQPPSHADLVADHAHKS